MLLKVKKKEFLMKKANKNLLNFVVLRLIWRRLHNALAKYDFFCGLECFTLF